MTWSARFRAITYWTLFSTRRIGNIDDRLFSLENEYIDGSVSFAEVRQQANPWLFTVRLLCAPISFPIIAFIQLSYALFQYFTEPIAEKKPPATIAGSTYAATGKKLPAQPKKPPSIEMKTIADHNKNKPKIDPEQAMYYAAIIRQQAEQDLSAAQRSLKIFQHHLSDKTIAQLEQELKIETATNLGKSARLAQSCR